MTISKSFADAMGMGDLTFEAGVDHNSDHPKDKTDKKMENKLRDYTKLMVSVGVILSAHHGFMLPNYEEVFASMDVSDQEKILYMLQNEIGTLEKLEDSDWRINKLLIDLKNIFKEQELKGTTLTMMKSSLNMKHALMTKDVRQNPKRFILDGT